MVPYRSQLRSSSDAQRETTEHLLYDGVRSLGPHGQRAMSNREQKLTTTLGKNLKQRLLREKRSRRARGLRALNLPTTATGSLKTAENGSLSDDGHNSPMILGN